MHLWQKRLLGGIFLGNGTYSPDERSYGQNLDSAMWTLVDGDINKVDGRTAFNAMRKMIRQA